MSNLAGHGADAPSRQFTWMSDNSDNASPDQRDTPPPVPPWIRATAEDVAGLDFEAPLNGATTADEAMEGLEGLS